MVHEPLHIAQRLEHSALSSELRSHRFPSVDVLIDSTLPFSTPAAFYSTLLEVWRDTFRLEWVGVAWIAPVIRYGHLATFRDGNLHIETFREALTHGNLEQCLHLALPDCSLQIASMDGKPQAIWVTESDFDWSIVPAAWESTSLRLLLTAIEWESQQTASRLEAMAEFAAGAGHEINNPLATIAGRATQLLEGEVSHERRKVLAQIGAQTYRIRDMITDTMTFARPPEPKFESLNLAEQIEETFQRFQEQFRARSLSLFGNRDPAVDFSADSTQVKIVISELLRNALELVPDGGTITIDALQTEVGDRHWAHLIVADDGPPLTEDECEHCFNPFYSGRQAGRGLGFGLSKCWRIVEQHGGQIDMIRCDGRNEVHVRFPIC